MGESHGRTTSLRVSADDLARLEGLARQLGYTQPRGPGKGAGIGNISALVRAIASGKIRLIPGSLDTTGVPEHPDPG